MLFIILFLAIFFAGAKFSKNGERFEDYLSLEACNPIKGIFVIIVFFRHYREFVILDNIWTEPYAFIDSVLGQMIVVAFLFYSGYGVMCSIESKGISYVKSLPLKRAAKVWIHYAIAVALFWIANLLLGETCSFKQVILTLLCWESIGNNTWYIMGITISYLLTYLSFRFCVNKKKAAVFLTLLTICVICILIPLRPSRYYNTLICFPLGVWWAIYKEQIDGYLKVRKNYVISFFVCTFAGVIANHFRIQSVFAYEMLSIAFVCVMVLITMKLRLKNFIIQYTGKHVFSIFILQTLPMMCLAKTTQLAENPYLFFGVSFGITLLISYLFDLCINRIDKLLFK